MTDDNPHVSPHPRHHHGRLGAIALVSGAFAYRSRRVDSTDKFEAWVRERFQAMFDSQMRDRDARIAHLEAQVQALETALSAKDVALRQCAGEGDRLRRERDDCLTKSRALYREYAALKQRVASVVPIEHAASSPPGAG